MPYPGLTIVRIITVELLNLQLAPYTCRGSEMGALKERASTQVFELHAEDLWGPGKRIPAFEVPYQEEEVVRLFTGQKH